MKLTNNERGPFTDLVRLTYADLIANSVALLAGTYVVATLPASSGVELVGIARPTAFTNATAISASIGTTSGTATEFVSAGAIGGTSAIAPILNTGTTFVQAAGNTTIKAGSLPAGLTAAAAPVYLKLSAVPTSSELTGVVVIGFRITNFGAFA